ncbi:Protein CBR-KLP-16.1 [Caenorhabditis briggsae]|uniref:Kinesin-like protein n=1 Tax=Caenorhabditis briggsae TaxID=6238 RepID=A8XGB4_CAEBR|nr:Protein CBR-KLP-16.1 [Caenorhabditis briggsae]CAP31620.1 Protein CBR-KLP-16.1 [Caenorhabditis briggsae]
MIGRRRSGGLAVRSIASRSIAARSPTLTASRRVTSSRGPLPSLAEPLPSPLTTGRHSTLGHSGCPALTKATSANVSRVPIASRPSSTSSRPPSTSSVRSVTSQRSTFVANKTIAAPARVRPVGRASVPVISRQPSQVDVLKAKVAAMEKDIVEKDERLQMAKETAEMQKESIEMYKERLEVMSTKVDALNVQVDVLKTESSHLKAEDEQKEVRIGELTSQLNEKESIMRKLHNDVVDLRGQIRVVVRVRPMLRSEVETSVSAIEYPTINSIIVNQGSKSSGAMTFEKVFTPIFTQSQVFCEIEDFILRIKAARSDGWQFQFSLSFLEIYNNEAYDLLNNHNVVKLRLVKETVSLDGLSEHPLKKQSDMAVLLRTADSNRKTASTKCNEYSSRSHAIYMWKIKAEQKSTGISTNSVLKLVDLAGSERAKESGVVGQQFKEMTNINQSLSVLQKCVSMQKSKSSHVPYRDSKLTQVLMDCLGRGNSKTMVMVNITPCEEQATESKRSIEFAAKMRDTHIGSAVQQRDQ